MPLYIRQFRENIVRLHALVKFNSHINYTGSVIKQAGKSFSNTDLANRLKSDLKSNFSKKPAKKIFTAVAGKLNLNFITKNSKGQAH